MCQIASFQISKVILQYSEDFSGNHTMCHLTWKLNWMGISAGVCDKVLVSFIEHSRNTSVVILYVEHVESMSNHGSARAGLRKTRVQEQGHIPISPTADGMLCLHALRTFGIMH